MQRPSFVWLSPILTNIGRRFGIDAHYFAKSSAFVVIAQVVNVLKGIIAGYLISRLFPAEMYGEYRFVVSVIGSIGILALSGMSRSISRSVARRQGELPLWSTMRMYAAICLIGAVVTVGCIALLPYWDRMNLWAMFLLAGLLFVPVNVGTAFFGGIVIGRGDFGMALKTNVTAGVLVIVSVLVMLLVRPSPLLLLVFTAGIPPLVYLWTVRKLMREYPSRGPSKEILVYALKMTAADIPMALSLYLDGLLISGYFGLKQLAVFTVATMIPEEVKTILKDFLPISFSRQAAGEETPARRRHLIKVVAYLTAVFAAGIAVYIALSPWIIPLMFPLYDPAEILPLTAVSAIILIVFPSSLFTQHLEARGKAREILIGQWLSSAVLVVALLALVPTMGLMGAILARGLFRFTFAGYAFVAVCRAPYPKTLPA